MSGNTWIYLVGGIGIAPSKPGKAPEWVSRLYGLISNYNYLLMTVYSHYLTQTELSIYYYYIHIMVHVYLLPHPGHVFFLFLCELGGNALCMNKMVRIITEQCRTQRGSRDFSRSRSSTHTH
jgi:hypothetical protein